MHYSSSIKRWCPRFHKRKRTISAIWKRRCRNLNAMWLRCKTGSHNVKLGDLGELFGWLWRKVRGLVKWLAGIAVVYVVLFVVYPVFVALIVMLFE